MQTLRRAIVVASRLMVATLCLCSLTTCNALAWFLSEEDTGNDGAPTRTHDEEVVRVSVIGTNDLHGHIKSLPRFAGFLRNLKKARATDRGGVLLVDAGDMFQGTLESNLGEGKAVVSAYNALGYDAVALGNHEFDFGPVGEKTAAGEGDDPYGALMERVRQARFPFLSANLVDKQTGEQVGAPEVKRSVMLKVRGVSIGVVGVSTEDTLYTTLRANVKRLRVVPLASAVREEAKKLRKDGARAVIVLAHAGGQCRKAGDDRSDLSSCKRNSEVFRLARDLKDDRIDLIVGGHTHQMVAHVVAGIPIIESGSHGRGFGRADLVFSMEGPKDARPKTKLFSMQPICTEPSRPEDTCGQVQYEGDTVRSVSEIRTVVARAERLAERKKQERLGVTFDSTFRRSRESESALCNLLADMTREALPGADVGLINAGGVRSNMNAGPLSYGDLFETIPFDNQMAEVVLTGAELRELLTQNLRGAGSTLCVSGLRLRATCGKDGKLDVTLKGKRRIRDKDKVTVATHDYLATGLITDRTEADEREGGIAILHGKLHREQVRQALESQSSRLKPEDYFDKDKPRLRFPGRRPVRCAR